MAETKSLFRIYKQWMLYSQWNKRLTECMYMYIVKKRFNDIIWCPLCKRIMYARCLIYNKRVNVPLFYNKRVNVPLFYNKRVNVPLFYNKGLTYRCFTIRGLTYRCFTIKGFTYRCFTIKGLTYRCFTIKGLTYHSYFKTGRLVYWFCLF